MDDDAKPETPSPERLLGGKFAAYLTNRGAVHLAVRVDGEDTDRHVEIPAAILKVAGMRAGGDVVEMLRGLRDNSPAA